MRHTLRHGRDHAHPQPHSRPEQSAERISSGRTPAGGHAPPILQFWPHNGQELTASTNCTWSAPHCDTRAAPAAASKASDTAPKRRPLGARDPNSAAPQPAAPASRSSGGAQRDQSAGGPTAPAASRPVDGAQNEPRDQGAGPAPRYAPGSRAGAGSSRRSINVHYVVSLLASGCTHEALQRAHALLHQQHSRDAGWISDTINEIWPVIQQLHTIWLVVNRQRCIAAAKAAGVTPVTVQDEAGVSHTLWPLNVQVDGMWHTRGQDSNSHVCTIICEVGDMKLPIAETLLCRTRRKCEAAETAGCQPPPHSCLRNARGMASRNMEREAFLDGTRDLLNSGIVFHGLRTDGNAAMHCALAEDTHLGWMTDLIQDQNLCANHVLKSIRKKLVVCSLMHASCRCMCQNGEGLVPDPELTLRLRRVS